jgi:hypothetical protein
MLACPARTAMYADDGLFPIETAQKVQVQVKNSLSAAVFDIEQQFITGLRHAAFFGHLPADEDHVCHDIGIRIGQIVDTAYVSAGHNEIVHGIVGIDVLEHNHDVVLVQKIRIGLSVYDIAENTLVLLGHVRLLRGIALGKESTTTREACGMNFLVAALAAGKKRQKHVWASMLKLQSHPVWARINAPCAATIAQRSAIPNPKFRRRQCQPAAKRGLPG